MEPAQQTLNLFITYVDKEGPFLKVWGQAEKSNSIYVEQYLLGASQSFDTGIGKIPFESLQVGTLVCAKYKDDKYYRARISSIDYLNESFVEVSFLDYGNKDIVPSENIRSFQNFPTSFISIPPLATGFIFAEAHCPGGGEWKDQIFEIISKELRYREVQCHLLTQATQYYLIKLFIDNTDIGALFINRGLMQPIPLHAQQAVLLSMSMQRKVPTPPARAPPTTEINTFKACTLEPNQQYAVYVSFVNEGPTHFSVQLQKSEHMLAKLMKEINEINLRMLEEVPLPGTICLARCQEDGHVCRAVVTNEVDNQFKVFYVDFGNYETLPMESLYQIPFKYVLPKVMAIRLALTGVEKPTVTLEMLLAFKKFVDNRLLHMKVLPSPKKIAIPKCELWDPATKTSAFDVISRAAQHAYPEPLLLNRGFTQPIKVSYVFSCNRFYVQLISKEQELAKLMEDLQISCQSSDNIDDIKIGLPCCALYEADQLWYRSEIVDVVDKENVKVRYIDYGNEEVVPVVHLRIVEGELLTVLRPQAIECCLNGYQNMGPDETRDNLLEELILEQNFTMKVTEMLEKKALVELIDTSNYNVASLLLDKIAASKSQASPMLVQAGNKIEHRKSGQSDSGDNFRGQRKPTRDQNKDWNRNDRTDGRNSDRTNDKSWRNENKDFRQNDLNSNDGSSDTGSWRQNNKGFNKNNYRNDQNDKNDGNQRGDRPNINDRFNRNKSDRSNDNWKKKDDFQAADPWSSPANDAAPPTAASNDWETSSPDQNNHGNKPRFEGGSRSFGGGRGDRGDRGVTGSRGGWQNKDGEFKKDGFKKDGFKKDFRKDGSEMSSSGSERSFKKGPRTSSRNDHGGSRFQNRSTNSFGNTTVNDSWSVSDVSTPIDAAPSTATYEPLEVVGTEAAVVISWFHNPGHFYCQLQSTQTEFRTLMEEIQQFYKNRKPETCVVGSPVVGLFPEDNVLYRAQVLEALGGQFKVFYVDFGNVSTITKVWPIEKKFMKMPGQAICCGLVGIGPNGDNWPEASSFCTCFQKEEYMARFLEKDENRTYMQLWVDQEEMSEILIRENLAVSVAQKPSGDIEVPLLLNQQIRVVLKSVNNLSDIIVALECGLALNCKAHNLEMASESFEDVLKAYLEQVLIIYVDNILENNVLDATFYDNEGNKLVILDSDEGALDNVEPLCPLLIISTNVYGYVSHADETSIFIQPSEYAEQIVTLLERMFEVYENVTEETSIIPEEGFIYAVRSDDGNWYRGRVISFDDDKATIVYVDYGNSESVNFSAIRELQSEFNVPNIMCLQVTVTTGSALSYLEKDVVASIFYGETGWEGIVEEYAQATPAATEGVLAAADEGAGPLPQEDSKEPGPQEFTLVHETIQGQDHNQEAAHEYREEYVQEAGSADQHVAAAETSYIADQKGTPVFVSHVDSPTEFYVQFAESETALDELQQTLQDTAEEMPVLENISVGALCAAPYGVFGTDWYRAEVLDADDDITTVRFVDYGNTDVINNMNTQIKTLPPHLLTLAVYATRCSLKLEAMQDEWSEQALELFHTLVSQENIVAEFLVQDEKTNIVELYVDGRSVKDVLLEQGLAVPCEIVTASKSTCFVSHLNSPSEFWVQMENCVDELEWIAEQLSGAEKFPELEDTTPGTLCAALFPDDDMWYRARILSNTIAGIELLFIDYGNSCVSSSLRQLPEDLVVTSPLGQKCCLQRPEGIPYWTKEAQNKFSEISADGQTIFEMKKITSGETATIELFLHGENVVTKILPVTEEGHVRQFETLDKFSIEKNSELLPENFSLEPMPGMEWDADSHNKFLELYPEGALFEIELISEDLVRLYQKGADIRPNLGGVKSSLNLSNTREEQTENLDISEDHVTDYEARGDTLQLTKHSSEDITQEPPCANESEQKSIENATETNQICDKEDISAESSFQDSGNVDTSSEKVIEAVENQYNVQDSETESGHHSGNEVHKEEETLAKNIESPKNEAKLKISHIIEEDKTTYSSSDKLQSSEQPAVVISESPLKEKRKNDSKTKETKDADAAQDIESPNKEEKSKISQIFEEDKTANISSDKLQSSEQPAVVTSESPLKEKQKGDSKTKETEDADAAQDIESPNKEEKSKISQIFEEDKTANISSDKLQSSEQPAVVTSESPLKEKQKGDSKTKETEDADSAQDIESPKKEEKSKISQILEEDKTANISSDKLQSSEQPAVVTSESPLKEKQKGDSKTKETKDADAAQDIESPKKEKKSKISQIFEEDKTANISSDKLQSSKQPAVVTSESPLKEKQKGDSKTKETEDADAAQDIESPKKEEKSKISQILEEDKTANISSDKLQSSEQPAVVTSESPIKEKRKESNLKTEESKDSEQQPAPDNPLKGKREESDSKTDETKDADVASKDFQLAVTPSESPKANEVKKSETVKASDKPKEESKVTKEVIQVSNKKEKKTSEYTEEESHSRPQSREGRRISHDDRILPGAISVPHSPIPDEPDTVTYAEPKKGEPYSRPPSAEGRISHDDRILPGAISVPHSPIPDEPDAVTHAEPKKGEPYSRPSSAEGRISHDDRIVPAVLSRPQTPILAESESN